MNSATTRTGTATTAASLPLWTSDEIASATGGTVDKPFSAAGVSIDSRTACAGDLFIALKGPKFDGHDFLADAANRGAAAALVSRQSINQKPESAPTGFPLVLVEDTMAALEDLARAARARSRAKIIGVTGSVGKTGTKEMLAIMLAALPEGSGAGKTHASEKSLNNHWGVPLTLARMPRDCAFGVFEMGMNHAGELTRLSALVRPHVAIITTIEPAHLGHFGSVEDIADAKAEIMSGLEPGGTVVLNHDNPHYARLKRAAESYGVAAILTFSEEEESADAVLAHCTLHSDSSNSSAAVCGEKLNYRIAIPGKHIIMNSLAALLAVKAAGGDLKLAAAALKDAEPVAGRGTRIPVTLEQGAPPVLIIDESYNASPAAMKAAFRVLEMAEPKGDGRRIAALGDMLELGREGPALHAGLANPLLMAKADLVYTCGPLMEALHQTLPPDWRGAHAKDSRELAAIISAAVRPGDVVLVKGSLGSRMAYVVQALQDRDIGTGTGKGKQASPGETAKDLNHAL